MSFLQTFAEMAVVLFAFAMGYLGNKLGYLGGEVDAKLTKIVLNITLPCMLIATVITGDTLPDLSEIITALKVAALFYLLTGAAALVLPRLCCKDPGRRGVWQYSIMFSNVGFLGYPVLAAFYGPEALFYGMTVVLPFNLLTYTLGPPMLGGKGNFKWKQMLSPSTIAAVFALVLTLTRFRPAALVGKCLDFVGDVTVPLSLLVVGSLLAKMPARNVVGIPSLWALTAIRLLALPALFSFILHTIGIEGLMLKSAVVQMGMPVAVTGSMLCLEHGGDAEYMAQSVFLSTLAAMITLPIVAAVMV